MKNCLVLGVNGQDGSFLAEILREQGHRVLGLGRQGKSRFLSEGEFFHYVNCDLKDQSKFREILIKFNPEEIYHLAAVHGPSGFSYEEVWGDALDVNIKSLHTVLEFARLQQKDMRIFYASSAKVFGTPLSGKISRTSQKRQDCLYSLSKLAAEGLLDYYRKVHGLHAGIAYLFNHESVRRPSNYFIPKVIETLVSAIDYKTFQTEIYTLDFYCDWGCAREYMEIVTTLIRANCIKDLILATGRTWYARDFVRDFFSSYDLDYSDHILEKAPNVGSQFFEVDLTETVNHLGTAPSRSILDVCHDIVKLANYRK